MNNAEIRERYETSLGGDSDAKHWLQVNRLNIITHLLAQIPEWVSVEDRLPEYNRPVLCSFKHWNINDSHQDVMFRVDEDDCAWRIWDLGGYQSELSHDFNVTRWMELPPTYTGGGGRVMSNDNQEEEAQRRLANVKPDETSIPVKDLEKLVDEWLTESRRLDKEAGSFIMQQLDEDLYAKAVAARSFKRRADQLNELIKKVT